MSASKLSPDFLEWLILKAREFDVKSDATGSVDDDDPESSVLEDRGDDPVMDELATAIDDLDVEAQIELVALAWLGRAEEEGSGGESFEELKEIAATERVNATSAYLLGMPLLSDYLVDGADRLGIDLNL